MTDEPDAPRRAGSTTRFLASLIVVAILAISAFLLLDRRPGGDSELGVVTLTFLVAIPATLSAIVALMTDPRGERGFGHYVMVPSVIVGIVLVIGAVALREGVICLLLVAPLWIMSGIAGSSLVYLIRSQAKDRGRLYSSALLVLPFVFAPVEAAHSPATSWQIVKREIVILAAPESVWPKLLSIRAIAPEEGRWNATQDLLGVPRPSDARLTTRGNSLVRLATWGADVRFEEHISGIDPLRSIRWTFAFPDRSVQHATDRHIEPKGRYLDIAEGEYRLERLAGGRTRVVLETRYELRSPLRKYASWWGEVLLGDIQENVLAVIKARAEAEVSAGSA